MDPLTPLRAFLAWAGLVSLALAAGLIGAYGRERHEGRRPDASWWLTRLCIMPFFAIVVTFCIDQFTMSRQQTALLASLLSMSGFEAVRFILERATKRGEQMIDAVLPIAATAKPYLSKVDTDDAGRATAHMTMTDPDKPAASGVGAALSEVYTSSVKAEMPSALGDLATELHKIDGVPGHGDGNHSADQASNPSN